MAGVDLRAIETEWFFTAPIEEVAVRRGDPLGLQAVAERVAEALAPGLSNRTVDARWMSILCWTLREGHNAWKAYGSGREPPGHGALGKDLYPWIRPLELLWVARAAEQTADRGRGRQLPGIRPVRTWIALDRKARKFSFAETSYEQYRFTGAYGGYRAALRALGGLTRDSSGWQLDERGHALAEISGAHVTCPRIYVRRGGALPTPEAHWLDAIGWKRSSTQFLPTLLRKLDRLDGDERKILRTALFAESQPGTKQQLAFRRRKVAEALAASGATTRAQLMADVVAGLRQEPGLEWLAPLPSFSQLADAGTEAMNACWRTVFAAPDRVLTLGEVAASAEVRPALTTLLQACRHWRSQRSNGLSARATQLADSLLGGSSQSREVLRRLMTFHVRYGGGLPWLALDGDKVRPVARLRDADASLYKYRLPALSRLAAQCGIIGTVPMLMRDASEAALAEPEGAAA